MFQETVSVEKVASALKIGVRLAEVIAERNRALLPDGTVDAVKLFDTLAIPSESLADLQVSRPVLLTVRDFAMRSGLSMSTIRSYASSHGRPLRFPRPIILSPKHIHFSAAEIAAYEYGVSEFIAAEIVSECSNETVLITGTSTTTRACSSNLLEDLDAIIPVAPRKKRVRKK